MHEAASFVMSARSLDEGLYLHSLPVTSLTFSASRSTSSLPPMHCSALQSSSHFRMLKSVRWPASQLYQRQHHTGLGLSAPLHHQDGQAHQPLLQCHRLSSRFHGAVGRARSSLHRGKIGRYLASKRNEVSSLSFASAS